MLGSGRMQQRLIIIFGILGLLIICSLCLFITAEKMKESSDVVVLSLIIQIIAFLAIASILGFIIGWLLRDTHCARKEAELEKDYQEKIRYSNEKLKQIYRELEKKRRIGGNHEDNHR